MTRQVVTSLISMRVVPTNVLRPPGEHSNVVSTPWCTHFTVAGKLPVTGAAAAPPLEELLLDEPPLEEPLLDEPPLDELLLREDPPLLDELLDLRLLEEEPPLDELELFRLLPPEELLLDFRVDVVDFGSFFLALGSSGGGFSASVPVSAASGATASSGSTATARMSESPLPGLR